MQVQVLYVYLPMSWRNAVLLALTYFVLTVIPEPLKATGRDKVCYYINYKPNILLPVKMGNISL